MLAEKYDHQAIEQKWQKRWEEERVFRVENGGAKKQYVLDMFPYPSADGLHVGHPEGYTATDIYSRFLRMNGQQVLHPMGWDAFGLPAENYAIKMGVHPSAITQKNITNFKRQIQSLGFSYDWSREVNTTDPKYYKWTQWIFLQLFKAGLAYEKEMAIWWCPKDKTGLANEEVVNGKCDRCGTAVEKKMLKQWMLKITAYADRLLSGLDDVQWPEGIKTLQRNWIGKSEGAEIDFTIGDEKVTVFTTRPDTLFGATYLVLAPEHALIEKITTPEQQSAVQLYIKSVAAKSDLERTSLDKEKTGVFTGAYAVNPINNEKILVWIADYVLSSYGTGAIMAVPAHDERDFSFAKKYFLPIVKVVKPQGVMPKMMSASAGVLGVQETDIESDCWSGDGKMMNSGDFDGLMSEEAQDAIVATLQSKGQAKKKTQYKLRDWVFSRQRYWGEPIPIVHCQHCIDVVESTPLAHVLTSVDEWEQWLQTEQVVENAELAAEVSKDTQHKNHYVRVTFGTNIGYWRVKQVKKNSLTLKHVLPGIILVPEKELPLELPNVEKYEPTGTGESPLAAIDNWVNVTCRVCGHPAKRETNTMPQWAGSCWYYLRFCDPNNEKEFASQEALKAWLPVDMYVGGAEHAVLHLMYARFWHKVLFDAGHIPKEVGDEPFRSLKNQGLILGPDGEKMSKSRGNVINPDEIIEKYGADTLRMYEMFMGPFEDAKPWNTNGLIGVRRFLEKVVRVAEKLDQLEPDNRWHKYVQSITSGIQEFRLNTCISDLMKWTNEFGNNLVSKTEFSVFVQTLSPFAPHLAEELWSQLGNKTLIIQEAWPIFDPSKVISESATYAIQVMGKLRATISMPTGSTQADVEAAAKANENVQKFLTSDPKKIIFVQGKLINFVI